MRKLLLASVTGCALIAVVGTADAAVYTVNTTADSGAGSLRAAVQAANAAGGSNTINLPAGRYQFTSPASDSTPAAAGDLDITSGDMLTVTGAGASTTIIDAAGIDRAFAVAAGAGLSLSGVTITNGSPPSTNSVGSQDGGAIYNQGTLNVSNTVLDGDFGQRYGGGIYTDTGSATVTNTTIARTYGQNEGGGLYVNGGTLTVTGTTFDGNATYNDGGGLYINGGTTSVTNSTFIRNHAGDGGAIEFNATTAPAQFTNDTIVFNSSSSGGGVDGASHASPGGFVNTIIAQNGGSGGGQDCSGTAGAADLGHNLDSDSSCFSGVSDPNAATALHSANPLLGLPAFNGGPTMTVALQAGSPAIDTAQDSGCPATDQRGVARPFGSHCDIGAYEYAPPANTAAPVISGAGQVGQTLACSTGSWSGAPPLAYGYQWNRAGGPIAGATGSSYTVQTADAGQSLTCAVTDQTSDGSVSKTSAGMSIAALPPGALGGALNGANPLVRLVLPGGVVKLSRGSRTFSIPLRNDNPFQITGSAHLSLPTIGVSSRAGHPLTEATGVTVPASSTRKLYISLSRYTLAILRHKRNLPIVITLRINGLTGSTVTVAGHYVLKAPPRG